MKRIKDLEGKFLWTTEENETMAEPLSKPTKEKENLIDKAIKDLETSEKPKKKSSKKKKKK